MKFYTMYAESCVEDYIQLTDGLQELQQGCLNSEFQYLNKKPLTIEVSEDGGMEFPDFILTGLSSCIPLISDKFKRLLDSLHINNLFYKPIYLTISSLGIKENYWLALPPRIKCMDFERSVIETEDNEYLSEKELIREADDIVINPDAVGNYQIFKLADVANQDIVITEKLKDALSKAKLENIYFAKIGGNI